MATHNESKADKVKEIPVEEGEVLEAIDSKTKSLDPRVTAVVGVIVGMGIGIVIGGRHLKLDNASLRMALAEMKQAKEALEAELVTG
jgi:hypothetical protein